MKGTKKVLTLILALSLLLSIFCIGGSAAETATWTSVWSTSMVKSTVANAIANSGTVYAQISSVVNMKNKTLRVAVTPQGSGDKVRFVLANDYGTSALPIKAITVGKTDPSNTRKVTGSFTTVKVNGKDSFSIPAGGRVTTDPVSYKVKAGEPLSVSIHYGSVEPNTIGLYGGDSYTHVLLSTNYTTNAKFGGNTRLTQGEQLYADDSAAGSHYDLIPTLCEVDTYGTQMDGCVVIFGDSTVTNDISSYMAEKFRSREINNLSVTMAAIKGNCLLSDGTGSQGDLMGKAGISRFRRDVLNQANVKYVFVKIGANDIIHPYVKGLNTPAASLESMKSGFLSLKQQSEKAGVLLIACEIAPWKGYTRNGTVEWTEEIDQLRLDVNSWMRTKSFGALVVVNDFFIDSSDPYSLPASLTTDGAHLNEAGQRKYALFFASIKRYFPH